MDFLLAGLVLLFVLVAEVFRRTGIVHPVFARKILHIGAISVSAFSVYFLEIEQLLLIIGLAIPLLAAAVFLGFFRDDETGRRSYGILYFAISFFALTYFFGADQPHLVYFPLMVLAWSDGLATVVGYGFGKRKLDFSPEGKTLEGALTFAVVTFVVLVFGSRLLPEFIPSIEWKQAFFMAVFLAILESLSLRSFDNLWVPAACAYWILILPVGDSIYYSLVIPVLAFFAFRRKWLTCGGAFAAAILGWVFVVNSQPKIIVFPAAFFLIGSLLSKLPGYKDEGSVRDADQVFANGLIPAVCFMVYFIWADSVFLIAGVSGFAFALSDTSASEIGVRMGGNHYKILNGKKTAAGVSGAITFSGSLAGMIFAFIPAALAYLPLFDFSLTQCLIIGAAGVIGNLTDSLIGDLFQAKYTNPDGTIRESAKDKNENPTRGFSRINNSTTNLLASVIACLFGLLMAGLI
ncbi:DUF92 domain-containing protein [Cryomorphaceae bacterium 1068]|nr:DUF92 domain-containing protein [Cryomorphaceae bacterium 1068]